jgi:hypothetical protein
MKRPLKAKYARLIREGITQAKRFSCFTTPHLRMHAVYQWARGMYAYEQMLQYNSAYIISSTMIEYTRRRLA